MNNKEVMDIGEQREKKKSKFQLWKEKREEKKEAKLRAKREKEREKEISKGVKQNTENPSLSFEKPLSNEELMGRPAKDPLEEKKKKEKRKKFFRNLMTIPELIIVVLIAIFCKNKYVDYSNNVHQILNYSVDSYLYTIERDNYDIKVIKNKKKACPIAPCEVEKLDEYEINFNKNQMTIIRTYLDFKFFFKSKTIDIKKEDINTDLGKKCLYSLIHNKQSFLEYKKYNKYKILDFDQSSSYSARGFQYNDQTNILVIALGEKPTSGYGIVVSNAVQDGDTIYFYINEQTPSDDQSQISLLTHPAVKIELEEKPKTIRVFNVNNGEEYPNYDASTVNGRKILTSIASELVRRVK